MIVATFDDVRPATEKPPLMFGHAPNITGGFHDNRSDTLWPNAGAPNAFWSSGGTEESYDLYEIAYDTRTDNANVITFDASRNSSVYNGTTMQPKALSVLPCIRY